MAVPTLAEFRTHLNVNEGVDTDNDTERTAILAAAVKLVEGHVGPLDDQSFTETHYGVNGSLYLYRTPVVSVTSLSQRLSLTSIATEYVTADLTVDTDRGLVRVTDGTTLTGEVTVTYTAGYATVPRDLWLAVLIVAAHLWRTQRGGGRNARTFDGAMPDDVIQGLTGFALPNAALELMRPYRTAGTIA